MTGAPRPAAWSIRRRLFATLGVVSFGLFLLTNEPVRRMETDAMVGLMREQYWSALGALVPVLQDQVITADADIDLPVLRRIADDFKQTYPAVRAMRIRGGDGSVLVESEGTVAFGGSATFEVSRMLRAGEYEVGEVEIVIDLGDVEAQAAQHVVELQIFFAGLLFLTAAVLVIGFYRLTVYPLRKIDEKLGRLAAGEPVADEPFKGAEEFLRLNDSVDALASAVQLQERQQELELQLQQSQKLEAVGRLAGGVAHDFNNLLTVILGYAETLVDDSALSTTSRASAGQIVSAGERAAALTRQLLAFSRKQVLRSSVVKPEEVLRGMEEMLGRLIGERIEVIVAAEEGLGWVDVDENQFEQVILNLSINSRDAMVGVGRLELALFSEYVESDTVIPAGSSSSIPAGEYVVFSVRDNGAGMDEETLTRIFEPFFTTKGAGEGTGLGLAMVYGIVSQSGGFLEVDSRIGEGTTFRLYLPSVEGEVETVTPSVPVVGSTVLVVEDEGLVRVLTREVLESEGYRVLVAAGAEDAMRIFEDVGEEVDLLLTDLVLPGTSGVELSHALRERVPEMKVLLVSGYDNGMLGPEERVIPFLQKPFERASLLAKVQEVLMSPKPLREPVTGENTA
ncbi:MAG: ATP-binding protein [Myxococcota bacterium]|nr:ATP-binding protein [Myxococcota bacterium]